MNYVLLYSGLLLGGMVVSQTVPLTDFRAFLSFITMTCLSYIMVEVGLEFTLDKSKLRSYGWDYAVAATAAAFPWIFCALYFIFVLDTPWKEAWLVGRFAAPTSAGILFTMLAAAGLSATWLFKKARILAIFDDLDTVLLMIPLQVMFVGFQWPLLTTLVIIILLLIASYRWLHQLSWPTSKGRLLLYGLIITALCKLFEWVTHVHMEVLLPAFAFGCILRHSPASQTEESAPWLDPTIKALFMLLVGLSLPKVSLATAGIGVVVFHVLGLTVLSNLGKCFPLLCYRNEVNVRERLALSVAMFPRGEVGAGVLLVAMSYGLKDLSVALAGLSLALNLLLTGVFIWVVLKLLRPASTNAL